MSNLMKKTFLNRVKFSPNFRAIALRIECFMLLFLFASAFFFINPTTSFSFNLTDNKHPIYLCVKKDGINENILNILIRSGMSIGDIKLCRSNYIYEVRGYDFGKFVDETQLNVAKNELEKRYSSIEKDAFYFREKYIISLIEKNYSDTVASILMMYANWDQFPVVPGEKTMKGALIKFIDDRNILNVINHLCDEFGIYCEYKSEKLEIRRCISDLYECNNTNFIKISEFVRTEVFDWLGYADYDFIFNLALEEDISIFFTGDYYFITDK